MKLTKIHITKFFGLFHRRTGSVGFTLVESLVAMLILSVVVLASAIGTQYFLNQKKKLSLSVSALAIEAKIRLAFTSPEIMNKAYSHPTNLILKNCIDNANCIAGDHKALLYSLDSSSLFFPDPDVGANNCLLDDGSTPCTCGSNFCHWQISLSYNFVSGNPNAIVFKGVIKYRKNDFLIQDRKLEMTLSGANFLVTPRRNVTDCASATILVGYTVSGQPVCVPRASTDCGEGRYVSTVNPDGSFTCSDL